MSRRMRRGERPSMKKINRSLDETRKATSASDYFPPGKRGVMGKAHRDPRTA